MTFRQHTIRLILIVTIVKLILGAWIELNNDEAYYWTYAEKLQWNYFDHPPMTAVLLWPWTFAKIFHHEFFLRIPFIFLGAGSCWLLFQIGKILSDERTGFLTACLFMGSFYGNFLGGFLILPDAPLLFFWLLAILLVLRLTYSKANKVSSRNILLLTGCIIGLAILSKAQGVFLWFGIAGFLVFSHAGLLKNPYLYLGAFLTLLMLTPAINWSLHNDFSNLNYHQGRIRFLQLKPGSFLKEAVGEILYANPIIFGLIFFSAVKLKEFSTLHAGNGIKLLFWSSLPLIFIVLLFSLFNDTLPHWNGPAYCTLLPVAALYLQHYSKQAKIPNPIKYATLLLATALTVLISLIKGYPGSLGNGKTPKLGKNDISLDMCGWRSFAKDYTHQFGKGKMTIITDYWFPAGHLKFYLPSECHVLAIGPLQSIHHFAWINSVESSLHPGEDALYISVSNYYSPPGITIKQAFQQVEEPLSIPQWRNGRIIRYFYVYRLRKYLGNIPSNGLLVKN